jgi:DNA-binding transcriptional ArsR family regulator
VCAIVLVLLASAGGVLGGQPAGVAVSDDDDHACLERDDPVEATASTSLSRLDTDRLVHTTTSSTTEPVLVSAVSTSDLVLSTDVDDTVSRLEEPVRDLGTHLRGPSGLVTLAGFSRFDDADPLEHTLRARLYETITRSPGAYPTELSDRLDTPRSTLRYHLRVLEDADLVAASSVDGKRRYVTTETEPAARALSVVDDGTTAADIVDRLGLEGTATVGELADDVDRSVATVSYHLGRLEDAGIVDRAREGQTVQNRLTPAVEPFVTSVVGGETYGAATTD